MPPHSSSPEPPLSVLQYGSTEDLPAQRALRAGPLTLVFENGDLRYVRLGAREVIRRWYVAVRDRNWGTVPARISELKIEEGADRFRITYDAAHLEGAIDFRWRATITGDPDGSLSFSLDGTAHSTFLRNRIGFCLLHSRASAGARARAVRADGTVIEGELPALIAPAAPFDELKAFAHE